TRASQRRGRGKRGARTSGSGRRGPGQEGTQAARAQGQRSEGAEGAQRAEGTKGTKGTKGEEDLTGGSPGKGSASYGRSPSGRWQGWGHCRSCSDQTKEGPGYRSTLGQKAQESRAQCPAADPQ